MYVYMVYVYENLAVRLGTQAHKHRTLVHPPLLLLLLL